MTQKIKLPSVLAINEKRGANSIPQLIKPGCVIEGTVANYQGPRLQGKVIVPTDGKDSEILVIEKLAQSPDSFSKIVWAKLRILDDGAVIKDLSAEKWLRHPDMVRAPGSGIDYRKCLDDVISSWDGAFSFLKENLEKKIKGLRSPQIGAIHEVHGHWSVSNAAATIVMPTGTGKTETMLSVMISEPCQKILVVVPTDALRTQIANKFLTLGILKDSDCCVLLQSALYPVVGVLREKPKMLARWTASLSVATSW
jgi:type III restriction/modification enzyme restriction subunit